jgi:hypothetical protein
MKDFPYDVLITAVATLAAGLGAAAWITGYFSFRRERQRAEHDRQTAREDRQRDAYAALLVTARDALRNFRQLRLPYAAGQFSDPAVTEAISEASRLASELGRTVAVAARRGRIGRPPKPACPRPPANLRQLAIASADQIQPVIWRQGTRATKGNPTAAMTSWFLAIRVRPANRGIPRAGDGSLLAAGRMATRGRRAHRLLAV